MRYYIYLSSTKIDMIFSQIKISIIGKLKASIKLNLGLIEVSMDGDGGEKELAQKAEAVRNYILSTPEVGTIEAPKPYIDDEADLSLGVIEDYAASIAIFAGYHAGKKIALIGSPYSLLGAPSEINTENHGLDYYLIEFLKEHAKSDEPIGSKIPFSETLEQAVDKALSAIVTPPRRVLFTAKVLHVSPTLCVATPIFVAET